MIKNEYLKLFKNCDGGNSISTYDNRRELIKIYSWAVPDDESLEILVKYSPIVEIGAGTGYWAYLANDRGAKITPYDAFFGKNNSYKHLNTWTKVYKGNADTLKKFDKKTNLFLCWPPYQNPMAYDCLRNFKGKYVIYIGEREGGCTGDDGFHIKLNKDYEEIECIMIPRWYGVYDTLYVYERKFSGRKLNLL